MERQQITKIILLIVALINHFCCGQTHRFIYTLQFKKNVKDSIYVHDFIVTDINKNNIKSYSYEFLKYDSINKRGSLFFANPVFEERFIRDLNSDKFLNFENLLENVYSYETNDKMEWIISNEFKKIANYNVQKAICTYGRRNWIAWFTTELPFPYGPYKFSGLPGMILEIRDDEENYLFSFYQNINIKKEYDTSGFLENFYDIKPLKINLSKLKKIKIDYYLDPYRELRSRQKIGYFQDDNGVTIEKPNYNKLSKEKRDEILKNNNPIELDKAVKYPEK
ncbi:MAG: GLPGLI family protein [Bergeyella sp.]